MSYYICITTSIHPDFDARIMKQAKSLASYGYKVDLICPWNCKDENIPGIGINFLTFKRTSKRLTRFVNYFRVAKYLIKRRYDLYHFHDIDILPLFCIVKFLTRKPVIYDIHENYPDEMLVRFWVPKYLRLILYFLVKHFQQLCSLYIRNLILVAPFQETEFGSRKYNKVIVRNFASKDLLKKKQDDYAERQDAIIFIGKQYINNGSLLFLKIAEKVKKKYPHVKFLSIDFFDSNDALRKQMITYIKKHGLQENIVFLPFIRANDIMSLLNKATIALLPNLRVRKQLIAIPTKMFEYMAAGLPIIASNLPYQSEILLRNNCGLVANPNSPDDFAEKICILISNRSKAEEMGMNGFKAFLENYCWETDVLKLKKIYKLLLKRS